MAQDDTISADQLSKIKKVHVTRRDEFANRLLRCGWVLLEVTDGSFYLGQMEKFVCPKCSNILDYHQVEICDTRFEYDHPTFDVNCSNCGKLDRYRSPEIDEYFMDKIISTDIPDIPGRI